MSAVDTDTPLLVGIDIGGTKTHVLAGTDHDRPVREVVSPSTGWVSRPDAGAVAWLDGVLERSGLDDATIAGLVLGARGYDTDEQAAAMQQALAGTRSYPCAVVNDALLLPPAAGLADGIGLIVGTGSIAVGRGPTGSTVYAGGWGWQLGDEGSAPGLVRAAARAVLREHELGGSTDPLADLLIDSFDAAGVGDLPERLRLHSGAAQWGAHAPVIFAALERGSALAAEVIRCAGADLADLVGRLRRRGVTSTYVVGAGGVIVGQQSLQAAVRAELAVHTPDASLHILDRPPVWGALRLAADLVPSQQRG